MNTPASAVASDSSLDAATSPALERGRGHPHEHVVGAGERSLSNVLDPELPRQLDSREVGPVLSMLGERGGLLFGARLQGRAQPSACEQHRDHRPE
jgi:hypothetical protein